MVTTDKRPVKWTFITVTYQSALILANHWATYRSHEDEVQWIVVDNSSTDNTAEVAESLGATVISLDENRGFAAANNVGLRSAVGEYIAFVNPDVEANYTSLDDLEQSIDKIAGLVAPQLTNPDGSLQPNGRGVPVLSRKIRNRLSDVPQEAYLLTVEEPKLRYVAWLTGAVVCGRRETIDRLGGWDELFFLYHEDSDLSFRAWRLSIPVAVDGSIRWKHSWARESASFKFTPWKRHLVSSAKFYSRHPRLLFSAKPRGADKRAIEMSGQYFSHPLISLDLSPVSVPNDERGGSSLGRAVRPG